MRIRCVRLLLVAAFFLPAACRPAPKPGDISPRMEQRLREIVREEIAASMVSSAEVKGESDKGRAEIRKLVMARIQEELARTDWQGRLQAESVVKTLRRLERAGRDGYIEKVDLSAYATPRQKLDRLLEELDGVDHFSGGCPLAEQLNALAPEAKADFYAALKKLKTAPGTTWAARQALVDALRPVLTAEDKDLLMEDLKSASPDLVDVVRKLRLQEGGDYALQALAATQQAGQPWSPDLVELAVDFHDEEALPLLLDRVTTNMQGRWGMNCWVAELLDKKYPDADLTEPFRIAAKLNDGLSYQASFSELLMKRGVTEGLDMAANVLASPPPAVGSDSEWEKVRVALRRYANVTGTDQEIARWLRENRDKLRWNRELGMFEEGAAAP